MEDELADIVVRCSNRTFMELKLGNSIPVVETHNVLIVSLWN